MLDIARVRRVAGRFARVPYQLQHVDDEVAIVRQEVGALRAEIVSLQSRVSTATTTIDFSAKSTLDILALTNRSIEGLSLRLDKLEKERGQHVP
jgi:hypothetical protein